MNKKIKVGILSYILFAIILLTNSVNAFSFSNTSLITDEETYYNHEKININASWELYYDSGYEYAYVRIQIFDIFDNNLWNSSRYYATGIIEKNWTVNIQNLNTTFLNSTTTLFIKMFYNQKNIESGAETNYFKETLTINIIKRGITCQLTDFKNILIFGESNIFKAIFFNTETNTRVMNETFRLISSCNEEILFQTNLTTNESGEIEFNISTISHLNLGRNKIVFSLKNNLIYNDTIFSYDVFVKKIPVFVDIKNFEDKLEKTNLIKIQLYYYYFFNQSKRSIGNERIKLVLNTNTTSEYGLNLMTNQSGYVNIDISPNNVIFHANKKSIYVDIIFNGTVQLENKTISINLNIENFLYQGISNLFFITNIGLFTTLLSLFSFISLKVYTIQKTKFKLIKDLTFKF